MVIESAEARITSTVESTSKPKKIAANGVRFGGLMVCPPFTSVGTSPSCFPLYLGYFSHSREYSYKLAVFRSRDFPRSREVWLSYLFPGPGRPRERAWPRSGASDLLGWGPMLCEAGRILVPRLVNVK